MRYERRFATMAIALLLWLPNTEQIANATAPGQVVSDSGDSADFGPLFTLCEKSADYAENTDNDPHMPLDKLRDDTRETGCQCGKSGKCKGQCDSEDGQCHCNDSTVTSPRKQQAELILPAYKRPDNGYPLRSPLGYWSHKGVNGRSELISHLQSGHHAGKFDPKWLASLSDAELESLHSDDHDNRLSLHVAPNSPVQNAPTPIDPPDMAVVEMDGKFAVYRLEVKSRQKRVCDGRSCRFVTEKYVSPVFQGWQQQ